MEDNIITNNFFKNNLFKRSISTLFLMPIFIYILLSGYHGRLYLFLIILILIHLEWYKINSQNSNSRAILYWSGWIYITLPFIYWISSSYNKLWPYNLSFFVIVWTCDIFAYIGGKLIGGKKFVPSISPNKTWSGVVCGIIFAEIFGQCCYYYFGKSMFNLLPDSLFNRTLFILVIAIGTVLGNLIE